MVEESETGCGSCAEKYTQLNLSGARTIYIVGIGIVIGMSTVMKGGRCDQP